MTSKIALLHTILAGTISAQGYASIEGTNDARELSNEGLIEVNPNVPGLAENHVAARITDAGRAHAEANPVNEPTAGDMSNVWGGQSQAAETTAPTNFGQTAQASQPQGTEQNAQRTTAYVAVSGMGFAPAVPAKREGAKRDAPEKYPFGTLKAPVKNADGSINYDGAVIFVPSTPDKTGKVRTPDEMAFSLQSACSAANRRYGKELPPTVGADGKSRKKYEYDRTFKAQGGVHNGQTGAFIYREFREGAQS